MVKLIEQLKLVSAVSQLANVQKSAKPEEVESSQTLLSPNKEGQLNVKDMANLIKQTNAINPKTRTKAQNIIVMMNDILKNGVQNEDGAIFQVIKDIATKKFDIDKLEKSGKTMQVFVKGANGKKYTVFIQVQDGDVFFSSKEGQVKIDKKRRSFEISSCSTLVSFNINTIKALPEVYAENN